MNNRRRLLIGIASATAIPRGVFAQSKLPVVGWLSGPLLSYGADSTALHRRSAYYVDRILKGSKPGDLPIEQPTTFELAVNLKTAKELGLTMPPEIMVRATHVIR